MKALLISLNGFAAIEQVSSIHDDVYVPVFPDRADIGINQIVNDPFSLPQRKRFRRISEPIFLPTHGIVHVFEEVPEQWKTGRTALLRNGES